MDLGAALIAFIISVIFKLPIMIFTAMLLVKMYKIKHLKPLSKPWISVPNDQIENYNLLYYSLILFFWSELFCAMETYLLMQSNMYGRIFHGLTSALGMGLFAVGLFMLFNDRVPFYGKKKCALNQVCKGCTIQDEAGCKFHSTILFVLIFIVLACIPPLFSPINTMYANPSKFILPFTSLNNWYDHTLIPFLKFHDPHYKTIDVAFFLPETAQFVENKVFPIISLIFATIGLIGFSRFSYDKKILSLKISLFAFGFLSYTYFELILNRLTNDLFIGGLGHEISELFFLIFLAELLVRAFPTGEVIS
jgi:hypothetical protein